MNVSGLMSPFHLAFNTMDDATQRRLFAELGARGDHAIPQVLVARTSAQGPGYVAPVPEVVEPYQELLDPLAAMQATAGVGRSWASSYPLSFHVGFCQKG